MGVVDGNKFQTLVLEVQLEDQGPGIQLVSGLRACRYIVAWVNGHGVAGPAGDQAARFARKCLAGMTDDAIGDSRRKPQTVHRLPPGVERGWPEEGITAPLLTDCACRTMAR